MGLWNFFPVALLAWFRARSQNAEVVVRTDILLESIALCVKKRGILFWCEQTIFVGVYLGEYGFEEGDEYGRCR